MNIKNTLKNKFEIENNAVSIIEINNEMEFSKGFIRNWEHIENFDVKLKSFTEEKMIEKIGVVIDEESGSDKKYFLVDFAIKELKKEIKKHQENIKSKRKLLKEMIEGIDAENLDLLEHIKFIDAFFSNSLDYNRFFFSPEGAIIDDNDLEKIESFISEIEDFNKISVDEFYNYLEMMGVKKARDLRLYVESLVEQIVENSNCKKRKYINISPVGNSGKKFNYLPSRIFGEREKGFCFGIDL